MTDTKTGESEERCFRWYVLHGRGGSIFYPSDLLMWINGFIILRREKVGTQDLPEEEFENSI